MIEFLAKLQLDEAAFNEFVKEVIVKRAAT